MLHELATTDELAGYLGVSRRTLERWRRQRIGPYSLCRDWRAQLGAPEQPP